MKHGKTKEERNLPSLKLKQTGKSALTNIIIQLNGISNLFCLSTGAIIIYTRV